MSYPVSTSLSDALECVEAAKTDEAARADLLASAREHLERASSQYIREFYEWKGERKALLKALDAALEALGAA